MTERPPVYALLGKPVTLHFPDSTFTTGDLQRTDTYDLLVNGWRVDEAGRFLALADGTFLY
jgi:hypothetical protein